MMNSSNNCNLISAFQSTANHSKIAIVIHYIFIQRLCQCFIAHFQLFYTIIFTNKFG